MKCPPVVLSIAGSDNSCGAGIQADLKTITALGAYGQTAVTCVVAEIPGRVESVQSIRTEIIAAQIRMSFEAFPVAAVKTGLLHSTGIIRAVARELSKMKPLPPLVVDPVMVASSGDQLLRRGAIKAYRELLFPLATVVTPNLDELRVLSGETCHDIEGIKTAGRTLADRHGCAFLLKGGHLQADTATDILIDGAFLKLYKAPFNKGAETHGTGCAFSAAIATYMAHGLSISEAVAHSKKYITRAINKRLIWEKTSALEHRL